MAVRSKVSGYGIGETLRESRGLMMTETVRTWRKRTAWRGFISRLTGRQAGTGAPIRSPRRSMTDVQRRQKIFR
jgi:hypothetical protein